MSPTLVNHRVLQNDPNSSYGTRSRCSTSMDQAPNESAPSSHMNAIPLHKAPTTGMASKYSKNKNGEYQALIDSRKCTAAVPKHNRKHGNDRAIHKVTMVDTKYRNQN